MKKFYTFMFISLFLIVQTITALPIEIEANQVIVNEQICSPTECYNILAKLGEGAYGEVFAVENSQGEQFALKTYKIYEEGEVINSIYTDSEREFLRGQSLNHPHIIKSIDFFASTNDSSQSTQNLILQLVRGQTLFATSKGTLSANQAINNAFMLNDALKYALSLGYMHLDLHAGNLMVNEHSEVMVIDLASFYTFEEILFGFEVYQSELTKESSDSNQPSTELLKAHTIGKQKNLNSEEALQIGKLKRIFKENPKFLYKLQKAAVADQAAANKIETFASTGNSSLINRSQTDHFREAISSYYFNSATEACIKFIAKSDLGRFEKLQLRAEIKKIAWEYEEDCEDQCTLPIEHYFEHLTQLLQTELKSNI